MVTTISFPKSTSFPTKRLDSLRKLCKQFVKRLRDKERSEGYQMPLFVPVESLYYTESGAL